MALTTAQQDFITRYVADLGRLKARRAKSKYADFARRYNKTEAALNVLPDGHPSRTLLAPLLDAAKQKAETGEFKEAYRDLETVKSQAKLAANGYVDSINAGALMADIDNLEAVLDGHRAGIDQAIRRVQAFQARLDRYPTAADQGSLSEAVPFLKRFARQESVTRADFQGRIDLLTARCDAAGNDDMPGRIARLRHKFDAAGNAGRMGEISEQVARVVVMERTLDSENGLYRNSDEVARRIKTFQAACDARIRQIKSLDSYKTDEDWASIKLDELVAMYDRRDKTVDLMFKDTEGEDLPDSATLTHATETDDAGQKQSVFLRLMQEEEARIERARDEMRAAAERDKALTDGSSTGRAYAPVVAEELERFDADDVLADVIGNLPDSVDNMEIMKRIGAIQAAIKGYLDDFDPPDNEVDEAFLDLLLQDEAAMFATIARAAGVPESPADCTDDHRTLIEQMARGAIETIREHSPNKMADDLSSIDVNGVTYQLDKVLGGGANGTARRYRDPASGETIIVKSLNSGTAEENRPAMVQEMRTHARLQKGDTTESKDSIAELKGAAVAEDGTLHMVMADAGGADLGKMTNAMLMMNEIGAIPPEARTAMAKDLIRQTIDGLKYLEEKNAIHNDLKPENIIIAADGKVKIIDFGESRFGDDEGKEAGASEDDYGTTKVYEAPEQWESKQKQVDKGVDTFAIGGILKALGGGFGETALGEDFSPGFEGNTTPFRAEEDIATGLDRVAGAAMSMNPDDRPSLDAIAESSYLSMDEDQRDHVPEDVADLKVAVAEYQQVLATVKSTIADKEIPGVSAGDKDMVKLQELISRSEAFLVNTRDFIKREEAAGRTPRKSQYDEVGILEGKIAALKSKRNESIAAVREAGAAEYQGLLEDEDRKIDFGAGETTIQAAMTERESALAENSKLRGAYYRDEARYRRDRTGILDRLDAAADEDRAGIEAELRQLDSEFTDRIAEVNRQLKVNMDKANTIAAAIESSLANDLTDAAKFHLADMRLREVGARFGQATDTTGSTSRAETAAEDEVEKVD